MTIITLKHWLVFHVCELTFKILVVLQYYQLIFYSFSCTTLFSIPRTVQTVSDIPWDVCAFFLQTSLHLFSSFCKFIKNWIKSDSNLFFLKKKSPTQLNYKAANLNLWCQASCFCRKMKEKRKSIFKYFGNREKKALYWLHLNDLLYVKRKNIEISALFSWTKMPTFLGRRFPHLWNEINDKFL